jgi:hypothetical protein
MFIIWFCQLLSCPQVCIPPKGKKFRVEYEINSWLIHVDIELISKYSIYMQIATSIMYKGFLLLDPCDAKTVDEYLRSENQHRMPGKGTPRSFQPAYNKNNFEGPGFNSTSTYIPNTNYRVPKLHLETWLGLDSVLSSTMKM